MMLELRQEQLASAESRKAKEQTATKPPEDDDIEYESSKKLPKAVSPNKNEKPKKVKNPKLKTAEDVIRRIQWDEQLDSTEFIVGYVDRFVGLQEKQFDEFSFKNFVDVDFEKQEFGVPQHRIQYFKWRGHIVWDKTIRMDYIFGSGNSDKTIFEPDFEFQ